MKYQHRALENTLRKYLDYFPVIGLTGPRQSGKSTLLQHTLPDYQYVTFDDYRVINLFHHDPERFIGLYSDHIFFNLLDITRKVVHIILHHHDQLMNEPRQEGE